MVELSGAKMSLKSKLKKYGLTEIEYLALLTRSGNKCEICKRPPRLKALSIDHNHKTGKIRGLLCYLCNSRLIGNLGDREDSVELYLNASEYLKRAK